MKKHNTFLQFSTLCIFSTLSFTNLSYAEKIYTWKDEAGKMHYTNNQALVPLEPKETRIINLKSTAPVAEKSANINGEEIWNSQCSQCHVLSAKGRNNLRGIRKLVDAIHDPSTTPTLDVIILQAAIDDEMDDLAKIELTSDEIQAVATYIRQQILKSAQPQVDKLGAK